VHAAQQVELGGTTDVRYKILICSVIVLGGLGTAVVVNASDQPTPPASGAEALGVASSNLKHVVDTPSGNGALLTEAHGSMRCVVDTYGGGTCQPDSAVQAGRAVGTSFCTDGLDVDRLRIRGLAPDGTTSVVVTYEDGKTYDAKMAEGVFVLDGPAPFVNNGVLPKSVTFHGSQGDTTGAVPLPGDVARAATCSEEDL
jgi:hypothetical protein